MATISQTGQKYDHRGKLTLKRMSLHEQVIGALRRMIVSGELPAGEKIRVNDLAEQLGVSLTPMREALKGFCHVWTAPFVQGLI